MIQYRFNATLYLWARCRTSFEVALELALTLHYWVLLDVAYPRACTHMSYRVLLDVSTRELYRDYGIAGLLGSMITDMCLYLYSFFGASTLPLIINDVIWSRMASFYIGYLLIGEGAYNLQLISALRSGLQWLNACGSVHMFLWCVLCSCSLVSLTRTDVFWANCLQIVEQVVMYLER